MSKSYRIKTTPGVDRNINVEINQDFDYLEILSLKLSQNDVYLRNCADYGVVVGRVIANNGFGVPNARVSVFIPITDEDAQNEVISTLYPYKTIEDINEDGYRYNLLPYVQQHGGHTPTGTFPTRNDAIKNATVVEIYDKYYKFVVRTNDSGDYMIMGVPTGTQTLVMDVDLSDIGPFSLSPNDLIRTGRASESQVAGNKFKASTNLRELPQIVNLVKTVEIDPLWGQPDLCNISIARADFDLRKEGGIDIQPTAIFMGSLISTTESDKIKSNCKVTLGTGSLCDLVAGPGEILAIRQTIFTDTNGDPVLEEVDLGEGGKVIDENGSWLLDVPMNLDYITTNEFGEQVLSNDPEVGIPTKGKYRFKVKWAQPNTLTDPVKRAYFLVPNIKELGWVGGQNPANLAKPTTQTLNLPANNTYSVTPAQTTVYRLISTTNTQALTITIAGQPFIGNPQNIVVPAGQNLQIVCTRDNPSLPVQIAVQLVSLQYYRFQQSYAFSINWSDYPDKESAINCEDTFYEMRYNKIYTVSQLIDQYKNGFFPRQTTAIKEITNRDCESENYRFPTNDAVLNLDILYFLFIILFSVITPILYPVLLVIHIIAFIWPILRIFFTIVYGTLIFGIALICNIVRGVISAVNIVPGVNISKPNCPGFFDGFTQGWDALKDNVFKNFTLANLTYEACTLCNCSEDTLDINSENPTIQNAKNQGIPGSSLLADLNIPTTYDVLEERLEDNALAFQYPLAGYPSPNFNKNLPLLSDICPSDFKTGIFSTDLTIAEKLNLFNTKGKYFDSLASTGGGWNQIKVKVNPAKNPDPSKQHYDNVLVMLCDADTLDNFPDGQLFSFVDSSKSRDWNITGSSENEFLTNSVTGTTLTGPTPTVTIECADPNNPLQNLPPVTYIVPSGNTFITGVDYYRFPADIEYFQVLKATTLGDFFDKANPSAPNSLYKRYFDYVQKGFYRDANNNQVSNGWAFQERPITNISNHRDLILVFMVRGVDPYSPKMEIEYDLSKIYGFNYGHNSNQFVIKSASYRLNVPIQKGLELPRLNDINTINNTNQAQDVYYNSFYFQPNSDNTKPNNFTGFTTTAYRFYSMLDKNFFNTNPIYPQNAVKTIANYAVINPQQNLFTKTFAPKLCFYNLFWRASFTNGNINGYYDGEYVEGGSIAYANILDNSQDGCNPCFNFVNLISPVYANLPGGPQPVSMYNPNKIVMRTDRLPTSSFLETAAVKNTPIISSFLLHQNSNFEMYQISDEGSASPLGGGQGGGFGGYGVTNEQLLGDTGFVNSVLETFSCESMQPLDCYKTTQNGLNFTLSVDGPGKACNTFRGKPTFKNGCYVTVTTPLLSFLEDIQLVTEWTVRLRITFALCRNVISHTFANNWVNGTLFAYSFQNDRVFTSPFSRTPNQASSSYCKDTIVLHDLSNTFYYRSSPYENGSYIGIQAPGSTSYRMNIKNLQSPTTIIDLGPRESFTEQLSLSNEYTGYIANRLNSTTYGDTSDIINLFVVSRLASQSFLRQLLSSLTGVIGAGADISTYFTRTQFRVDADFAQAISTNSELGIPVFSASNYPDNPVNTKQSPIFFNPEGKDTSNQTVQVFGIFFSSDTQTRDLVTPRRLIRDDLTPPSNPTAFDYLPMKSQNVPFYLWEIRKNTFNLNIPGGGQTLNGQKSVIFGTQTNNWKTDLVGNTFFNFEYQKLDRILTNEYQFLTNEMGVTRDMKGYIYNVVGGTSGDLFGYTAQLPNFAGDSAGGRVVVGAPYHFYFGLKRGKSAMDRFIKKWVDTTIEIE